jgi:hypothetical protein
MNRGKADLRLQEGKPIFCCLTGTIYINEISVVCRPIDGTLYEFRWLWVATFLDVGAVGFDGLDA